MFGAPQALAAMMLVAGPEEAPHEEPAETEAVTQDATSTPKAQTFASLDEGFGVKSSDGKHKVRLGILTQFRGSGAFSGGSTTVGFSAPLVRPYVRAQLWNKRVTAWVLPEFGGGNPQLLDASGVIKVNDGFQLQLGQFRPWLSRGYRTGLNKQALGTRGLVVDTFRIDRDIGLTLRGQPLDGRFEYYFGVFNGEGKNAKSTNNDLLYTARMVVAPMGRVAYDQVPYVDRGEDMRMAIGASGYTVEVEEPAEEGSGDDPTLSREVGASGDLVVSGWRLSAGAEGFWRSRFGPGNTRQNAWGGYGQLSALLVRDRLDIAARAGVLDQGNGAVIPLEGGFNVYMRRHQAKLQLRYHCNATLERNCASQGIMAQLQLWI
jgi:hypothetical protein